MSLSKEINNILNLNHSLFQEDYDYFNLEIKKFISKSNILIIGGAGSIGRSVFFELLKCNPKLIHIIDISENNLVEVVRYARSQSQNFDTEIKTFVIDINSTIFDEYMGQNLKFNYILNFAAIKHVRSDRDIFTLKRLILTNIIAANKISNFAIKNKVDSFFTVSSDKATNPTNFMGASKRIMELFLLNSMDLNKITMARFANVAFSDGSLLNGFEKRFEAKQPFSSPIDIKRYFINHKEAAQLCILSSILGSPGDNFFPKQSLMKELTFSDIAVNFLEQKGFKVKIFDNEDEAKSKCHLLIKDGYWPCYFFYSDTSGEKSFEEFYVPNDELIKKKFKSINIIKNKKINTDLSKKLEKFLLNFNKLNHEASFSKNDLNMIFKTLVPEFSYIEKGINLDQRM